jgi:hypothetical protein
MHRIFVCVHGGSTPPKQQIKYSGQIKNQNAKIYRNIIWFADTPFGAIMLVLNGAF